ncbi:unnamed protein product [Cuscuta europaea]|uniref:DUF8040 domain-containing protein n=1 Tax=Cuscuta europaea TaxID=41803 RepID=A0A9P0YVZ1_CUSEU|nr:unnamed protein product [Cuscuta europaea]
MFVELLKVFVTYNVILHFYRTSKYNVKLYCRYTMSHVGSGGDISDSASDEDDEFGALLLMVTCVLVDVERIPCRTSILTGNAYIDELLIGHPLRCYESFRMNPHVFLRLCERLKNLDVLHDSRYLRAEEQL